MKSEIGRPSSPVDMSASFGVKRLIRRLVLRKSVAKSVALIKFCRSLCARETASSLSLSSLLSVCSSSLLVDKQAKGGGGVAGELH